MMKITVLDGYTLNPGDISWKELEDLGEVTVYDRTLPEEIIERSEDADIILTNKVIIDKDIISRLPRLRYIGVLATGYNVVDVEAARDAGIVVTNIPAYSTDSVAQHIFAMLLSITNHAEYYAIQNREGKWSRSRDFSYQDFPLPELAGKTMGIVGYGNIGHAVAKIASAFGMKVIVFSSKPQDAIPEVEKRELEELFSESDVICLCCPLTPDTKEMVNREMLARMKPLAILINTGRGPLVNESDVADALNSGEIYAFGADVLSSEPPAADNPLLSARNSYITPHIAWASKEARERLMSICAANIRAFLSGKPENQV